MVPIELYGINNFIVIFNLWYPTYAIFVNFIALGMGEKKKKKDVHEWSRFGIIVRINIIFNSFNGVYLEKRESWRLSTFEGCQQVWNYCGVSSVDFGRLLFSLKFLYWFFLNILLNLNSYPNKDIVKFI